MNLDNIKDMDDLNTFDMYAGAAIREMMRGHKKADDDDNTQEVADYCDAAIYVKDDRGEQFFFVRDEMLEDNGLWQYQYDDGSQFEFKFDEYGKNAGSLSKFIAWISNKGASKSCITVLTKVLDGSADYDLIGCCMGYFADDKAHEVNRNNIRKIISEKYPKAREWKTWKTLSK